MKKVYLLLLSLTILLPAARLQAQEVAAGKVTAYNQFPLGNVLVKAKKSKMEVRTDTNGMFRIPVEKRDLLIFEAEGFVPLRIRNISESMTINLIFKGGEKNKKTALENGYISEEEISFAMDKLVEQNNDFAKYSNIFDLIRGRFAGVQVQGNSVLIRGQGTLNGSMEPLYVVDGVPRDDISTIPPSQVKSIRIIKDGSAAIYGVRGANGVILIEMRKK